MKRSTDNPPQVDDSFVSRGKNRRKPGCKRLFHLQIRWPRPVGNRGFHVWGKYDTLTKANQAFDQRIKGYGQHGASFQLVHEGKVIRGPMTYEQWYAEQTA